MDLLRFDLRTRAGEERRAGGRLQQAFGSLCAHVDVFLSRDRGQLRVLSSSLHRAVFRKKPASVNQTGRQRATEDGAAVLTDVSVAVWIHRGFSSAFPRPRAFDIFVRGLVGSYEVRMEAREAHNGPD